MIRSIWNGLSGSLLCKSTRKDGNVNEGSRHHASVIVSRKTLLALDFYQIRIRLSFYVHQVLARFWFKPCLVLQQE